MELAELLEKILREIRKVGPDKLTNINRYCNSNIASAPSNSVSRLPEQNKYWVTHAMLNTITNMSYHKRRETE